MSKHIFEHTQDEQTYEIQLGWDKPLQRYYGVISPWVEDDEMDEGGYFGDPLWSTALSGRALGLDDIADTLIEKGFRIPNGVLNNVVDDQLRNAVNEVTVYDPSGTIIFSNNPLLTNQIPVEPL